MNLHTKLVALRSSGMMLTMLAASFSASQVAAQATDADTSAKPTNDGPEESDGLEEIIVTAQKRGVGERAQDVPIAISAFSSKMLEERAFRDLSSLTASMPNVSLDSGGTLKGQANFEIRGFGIASSIPSVEPTVGVFIDGVYQGQTMGIMTDMFDVESLEILRGPQGTLFGRNTTGGAVLIRTSRPGETLKVKGLLSVESGPNFTAGLSVEGPLAGGAVRAKIAGYSSRDEGYFHNKFDNQKFGENSTYFIRPTVVAELSPGLETTLIFEYGTSEGDGPAAVNTQVRDGFNLNQDFRGRDDNEWTRFTSETNWKVGLGGGVITNIFGYGKIISKPSIDAEGLPQPFFNIDFVIRQHQYSNELRYAGSFGPIDVTIGGFYYGQNYSYIESRRFSYLPRPVGYGGVIDQDSAGAFANITTHLSDDFSVILGGRYSWERKIAQVATFDATSPRCDILTEQCTYNFPGVSYPGEDGRATWKRFSPKVGFQWKLTEDSQVYGSYSEGIRSGGFNVRSNGVTVPPGPYDMEVQDAFELGLKSDLFDRHLRVNGAVFYNKLHGLQRDVTAPDAVVGVVQSTQNVGTAEIYGAEGEVQAKPLPGLTVGAHFGYLHGKYVDLTADLNGALPGFGEDLQLVRLPKWTYGFNMAYEYEIADGSSMLFSTIFGHVDTSASQDNNLTFLSSRNLWDASLSYMTAESHLTVSIYAKNILNDVTWNNAGARAAAQGGGTSLTINKGRVIGASVRFSL